MEHSIGLLVLVFVISSLIVGSVTLMLTKGTKIPYTVALLLIGLILGGIDRTSFFKDNISIISDTIVLLSNIDPHLILFVFLPTLIFESAFSLEVHLFKRMFSQIAILAVPGLIVSTILTAVLAKFFFPWGWGWELAFMFGALISATDPVAVVALLKEVSSRKRLETLIEGESLLNDGTAIVLFTLFFGMIVANNSSELSFFNIVIDFSYVVFLGLIVGVIFGYMAIMLISRVFNNPLIEITLSVGVAYLVFFVAEHSFHVSGVVALVALALMFSSIGKTKISPEVEGFLHHFWEMLAHIANTLIFLLVGILIATRIKLDIFDYWYALFILYIGVMIIRGASVTMFIPVLKRVGIGITKEKAMVLTWGGLRGAVSLALALSVAQSDLIPKEIGDQILFLTAGIVVLTILINGMTMEKVLSLLGLDKLPPAKEATVNKAKAEVQLEVLDFIPKLKRSEFLHNVKWDDITTKYKDENLEIIKNGVDEKNITDEDLEIEFKRRLLESERKFYWLLYKKGALSATAQEKLTKAVEEALDGYPTITPRASLNELWHISKMLHKLKDIKIINSLVLKLLFSRIALGYEVARGFIEAQNELLHLLKTLAPNKESRKRVKKDILQNKKNAFLHISHLTNSFPEVVYAMQTSMANMLILNKQRSVIKKLLENGVLDKPEASKMIDDVESSMSELLHMPIDIKPPSVKELIEHSPLSDGLKIDTIKKLQSNFKSKLYEEDEIIIKQNTQSTGLIFISRGSVEIFDEIRDQSEDIVNAGSFFGSNCITKELNKFTVKSSLPVQILFLKEDDLKKIISDDSKLGQNISELSK